MYFMYLRTFVYVYKTGSYGNAAEALNMTHPTVSKHIAALEQQVGKTLFRRDRYSGKSYRPTSFAKDLAKELVPYIDKVEHIFESSRITKDSAASTIYFGGLTEFIQNYLADVITKLSHEDVSFMIKSHNTDEWTDLLEDQSLDMAIIPIPVLSEHIGFREIITDELCMVAHSDLVKRSQNIKEFLDLPYIAHETSMPCVKEFMSHFPLEIDEIQCKSAVCSFELIKTMVIGRADFSILPKGFIANELKSGRLICAKTNFDPIYMRLYLAWNKFTLRKKKNIIVHNAILRSLK